MGGGGGEEYGGGYGVGGGFGVQVVAAGQVCDAQAGYDDQSRPVDADALDDDELLAQLGVEEDKPAITQLRHVRSAAEKQAADIIADRTRCANFTDGPLFADAPEDGDRASGTVYVLRSKSADPQIASQRDLLHKIGVTNMPVERRIANARKDPTFLLADVQIVATYKLYSINRTKLENLIHHVFAPARLDIQILDRFGNPVSPREWFLVPWPAIDEAVKRIKDNTITQYTYNPQSASLQKHSPKDG